MTICSLNRCVSNGAQHSVKKPYVKASNNMHIHDEKQKLYRLTQSKHLQRAGIIGQALAQA
jgi:hypothetical protein